MEAVANVYQIEICFFKISANLDLFSFRHFQLLPKQALLSEPADAKTS